MDVWVYSRPAIERVAPHDVPHVVISITSTPSDVARIPSSPFLRGILRLSFADVEEPERDTMLVLFDAEHARAIHDFVVAHRAHVERILVHCDAGVSRSPAVAAAITRALGGDDADLFTRYRPNRRVYRLLLAAFGQEVSG
jgi:predicted protein tyrosine phosphatase